MQIRCQSSVSKVYVRCYDNLPFYAMLMLGIVSSMGKADFDSATEFLQSLTFMSLVVIALFAVAGSLVAHFRLSRSKARQLTAEEDPLLHAIVCNESRQLGLRRPPVVYVVTSNRRASARVLGGFSS